MFLTWAVFGTGIYLIFFAFTNHTRDFKSRMVYNFLPFVGGVFCILNAIATFGWIQVVG